MHQLNRVGWFVLWATACVGFFGFKSGGIHDGLFVISPVDLCAGHGSEVKV